MKLELRVAEGTMFTFDDHKCCMFGAMSHIGRNIEVTQPFESGLSNTMGPTDKVEPYPNRGESCEKHEQRSGKLSDKSAMRYPSAMLMTSSRTVAHAQYRCTSVQSRTAESIPPMYNLSLSRIHLLMSA